MNQQDVSDSHLDVIFHHGAFPLWMYLHKLFALDIVDVCSRVAKSEPVLVTCLGTLAARMVHASNTIMLPPPFNNDVIFLLNSINTVFESLKIGIERDGVKILEPFRFTKDVYNNIYLINIEGDHPIGDIAIAVVRLDDETKPADIAESMISEL
jgi:hypothetical protein